MMTMNFVYPARITEEAPGEWLVTFPDVPEAITGGENREEALEMAEDALAVALLARIERNEPLPSPSPVKKGLMPVSVPAPTAAKLVLIDLWRRSGLSKSAFARLLGVDEKAARRLLDPNHNTSLSRLDSAIRKLGGRLVISMLEMNS